MAEEPATAPAGDPEPTVPGGDWLDEREGIDAAIACVGSKLDEAGGGAVARVEAVLADAADGSPSWLVVRLGRFGKRAAIPFDYVAPGVGRVWTPFDRDAIRAAAELDPSAGLSAADERALLAHYGIPGGSGRQQAIAERGEEEPSSIPV